ncbi:MAG: adenine phosphoribosyltransferase [Planctomycetia bacterium]|nr:adenine phosphoribosyltransferase [Planctomycetia bacterium]
MKSIADYIRSIPDFPSKGIIFRDITPLIENSQGFSQAVTAMAEAARALGPIDKIAAPEARGFIFGAPLAAVLGVGFVPIRKPGKLPCETVSVSYSLEYGTDELHIHKDSICEGDRVLIVDDLLATGGTIDACRNLIQGQGGIVVGFSFAIELVDLKGRAKLNHPQVNSLVTFEGE